MKKITLSFLLIPSLLCADSSNSYWLKMLGAAGLVGWGARTLFYSPKKQYKSAEEFSTKISIDDGSFIKHDKGQYIHERDIITFEGNYFQFLIFRYRHCRNEINFWNKFLKEKNVPADSLVVMASQANMTNKALKQIDFYTKRRAKLTLNNIYHDVRSLKYDNTKVGLGLGAIAAGAAVAVWAHKYSAH